MPFFEDIAFDRDAVAVVSDAGDLRDGAHLTVTDDEGELLVDRSWLEGLRRADRGCRQTIRQRRIPGHPDNPRAEAEYESKHRTEHEYETRQCSKPPSTATESARQH
ncbi:hypothetical protein [Nocardia sp. R7R-8]|uniref:hypothetical protein n=1 Tax=Nocardia sp. R7R-8 TaxID=3459304 RepID=UPI00403D5A74